MDAYSIKEQIGTLFVLVGAPEGGFRGGQGGPPQKVNVPSKKTPSCARPDFLIFARCHNN